MHYLLYYGNTVLDSYGTVELLRLALLILTYNLYSSNHLEKFTYESLKEKLSIMPFTVEDFSNIELNNLLKNNRIKIETISYTKDSYDVLEKIKNSIHSRLENLKEILDKDNRIKVTIPGENAYRHRLGTMYRDDWRLVDSKNYTKLADDLHEYISGEIIDLTNTYGDRITFGDVLYQNANSLNYNLWSANAVNYDLGEGENIPGDYQASEMKIQAPGVYGIIVTPRYGF